MKHYRGFEHTDQEAQWKLCGNALCKHVLPICFAQISPKCSANRYTCRWNHVSVGEHFCNDCFENIRSRKASISEKYESTWHSEFVSWKQRWMRKLCELTDISIRDFFTNVLLPHWARCRRCEKWRQLTRKRRPTPEFLANFECRNVIIKSENNPCSQPEDNRVDLVRSSPEEFMCEVRYLVLLEHSAAQEFLTPYPMDRVGIAPTAEPIDDSDIIEGGATVINGDIFNEELPTHLAENPPRPKRSPAYFHPFQMPSENGKASTIEPDKPQQVEMTDFPEFDRHPDLYLGLRNLLIAMWYRNPKAWLTVERAAAFTCVRGLFRIALVEHCLPALINCFTCKGLINTGLLNNPPNRAMLPPIFNRESVVVIGAGIAGLATARQLGNMGTEVMVLEASDRIGGRIHDFVIPDNDEGLVVPEGAQIIHGCVNNPITLLAHQGDMPLRIIPNQCVLIGPNGRPIDELLDKRLDFHVEALLNRMACEKRSILSGDDLLKKEQKSLQAVFDDTEAIILPQLKDLECNELERGIIEFHLAELDLCIGGGSLPLTMYPWLSWDCHALHLEFPGASVSPQPGQGFSQLMNQMATDLDIKFNTKVVSIDLSSLSSEAKVVTDTQTFRCSKVVLAIPPCAVSEINISPPLPKHLQLSDTHKNLSPFWVITLGYDKKFWRSLFKVNHKSTEMPPIFFAGLPSCRRQRGFCHVFQDMFPDRDDMAVVQTQVFGECAVDWLDKDQSELIQACDQQVRSLFTHDCQDYDSVILQWNRVKLWKESYSRPVVSDVQSHYLNKLCWVGESRSMNHPMSLAGAYLSGVFEAGRIVDQSANRDTD